MLLGNADIEDALRESLAKKVQPRACRHGGGDGDDLVVVARFLNQACAENLGVARRICRGFACLPVMTSNLLTP